MGCPDGRLGLGSLKEGGLVRASRTKFCFQSRSPAAGLARHAGAGGRLRQKGVTVIPAGRMTAGWLTKFEGSPPPAAPFTAQAGQAKARNTTPCRAHPPPRHSVCRRDKFWFQSRCAAGRPRPRAGGLTAASWGTPPR